MAPKQSQVINASTWYLDITIKRKKISRVMQLIEKMMFFDSEVFNILGVKTEVSEALVEEEIEHGGVKVRI